MGAAFAVGLRFRVEHEHEHEHEYGVCLRGLATFLGWRGGNFAAGQPSRVVHEHEHGHGVAFVAVPPSGIEYEQEYEQEHEYGFLAGALPGAVWARGCMETAGIGVEIGRGWGWAGGFRGRSGAGAS